MANTTGYGSDEPYWAKKHTSPNYKNKDGGCSTGATPKHTQQPKYWPSDEVKNPKDKITNLSKTRRMLLHLCADLEDSNRYEHINANKEIKEWWENEKRKMEEYAEKKRKEYSDDFDECLELKKRMKFYLKCMIDPDAGQNDRDHFASRLNDLKESLERLYRRHKGLEEAIEAKIKENREERKEKEASDAKK